jgi:hypothetical protein
MRPLTCPFCDRANADGARYCSSCGSRLYLRTCRHCDAVNDMAVLACYQCGSALPPVSDEAEVLARAACERLRELLHGGPPASGATAVPASVSTSQRTERGDALRGRAEPTLSGPSESAEPHGAASAVRAPGDDRDTGRRAVASAAPAGRHAAAPARAWRPRRFAAVGLSVAILLGLVAAGAYLFYRSPALMAQWTAFGRRSFPQAESDRTASRVPAAAESRLALPKDAARESPPAAADDASPGSEQVKGQASNDPSQAAGSAARERAAVAPPVAAPERAVPCTSAVAALGLCGS